MKFMSMSAEADTWATPLLLLLILSFGCIIVKLIDSLPYGRQPIPLPLFPLDLICRVKLHLLYAHERNICSQGRYQCQRNRYQPEYSPRTILENTIGICELSRCSVYKGVWIHLS